MRAGLATAVALAATSGALPSLMTTAHAGPIPVTIPAPDRFKPVANPLYGAGPGGVVERTEVADASALSYYRWFPDDGTPVNLPASRPSDDSNPINGRDHVSVTSGDTVAIYISPSKVLVKDMESGPTTTYTLPAGHFYRGVFGSTVLTATKDANGKRNVLHVLRMADGQLIDTLVTGLNGWVAEDGMTLGGDDRSVAIWYAHPDGTRGVGLLDLATAEVTPVLPGATGANAEVVFSDTHIAWYSPEGGNTTARVLPRATPQAAATEIELGSDDEGTPHLGLVGDWLLTTREFKQDTDDLRGREGAPLTARPIGGGEPETLLEHARWRMAQVPGGGVAVTGGTSSRDWAVHRVHIGDDRAPALRKVRAVAPKQADLTNLSLTAGQLVTAENDATYLPALYQRDIGAIPSVGERSLLARPDAQATGYTEQRVYQNRRPVGTGDGRTVVATLDANGDQVLVVLAPDGTRTVVPAVDPETGEKMPTGPDHNSFVRSASGRYVVFGGSGSGTDDRQYVVDLDAFGGPKVIRVHRGLGGLAVWGTKLWMPGVTEGTLQAVDLKTGEVAETEPFTFNGCAPKEMQAVGHWVYWDCDPRGITDSGHGVYNTQTRRTSYTPRGVLGDGYVLAYQRERLRLLLTPIGGNPYVVESFASRYQGPLVETDRFGGTLAYSKEDDAQITVVDSGVATAPVAEIEARVEQSVNLASPADPRWDADWQLSKPATGTQVMIRDKTGRTVLTAPADEHAAAVAFSWDGRTDNGLYANEGTYTWELTAAPADGSGALLKTTGTIELTNAQPTNKKTR
ncbi:FlgD immunoglobulin-like domain containing protein [Streptomyces sp. CMB-StM0423]|uniref:FlgD immunoglobulin-like domain containing protein n=1 Tax=Streptomyces sp. CMB-StM0423 TaxID=2059884 RepID=UPI00131B6DBE|nr:FlgD immunoglobulin-like domain containing protein [Streptomyces sp. CMB-StM0423]